MLHLKEIVWAIFLLYLLFAVVPKLMALGLAPRPLKEPEIEPGPKADD